MTNTEPTELILRCRRDTQGRIVALTRQSLSELEAQTDCWEVVQASDADVEAFVQDVSNQANPMRQSDIELSRVLEDLIDLLIDRGLIQFTDLPAAAQIKLMQRRLTRDQYSRRLNLLTDDGS